MGRLTLWDFIAPVEGEYHEEHVGLRDALAEATGDHDPLAFSFLDTPDVPSIFIEQRGDAPWRYPEHQRPDVARRLAMAAPALSDARGCSW